MFPGSASGNPTMPARHITRRMQNSHSARLPFLIFDGFVKSDLLRWRPIFAESNSEKRPHCHFERQREILNNQDSSSLSFLGMTAAEASKTILNIVEFLGSNPPPGPRPGTEPKSNFCCMLEGTETIHPILSFRAAARNLLQPRFLVTFVSRNDSSGSF